MNKQLWLIVAFLVVVSGASASCAVQIDPDFAGRISIRQIDNGIFGALKVTPPNWLLAPAPILTACTSICRVLSAVCSEQCTIRRPD